MRLFIASPVSASRLARLLNRSMKQKTFNESIAFFRHPVERFWSAVKKDFDVSDVEGSVSKGLEVLKATEFSHYLPQTVNIVGEPVTHVIKIDQNFSQSIVDAVERNKVEWIENFVLSTYLSSPINATPSFNDKKAFDYITADSNILNTLHKFYEADFAVWEDTRKLINNA